MRLSHTLCRLNGDDSELVQLKKSINYGLVLGYESQSNQILSVSAETYNLIDSSEVNHEVSNAQKGVGSARSP